MCDEVVANSLAALTLILDWLATSKMVNKLHTAFTQMMVYSFLMKILVLSHFIVIKWVVLV